MQIKLKSKNGKQITADSKSLVQLLEPKESLISINM